MALVSIDVNDARPIYIQIMDEVRRAIVVGTLAPDDPLPSIRQLAGELGVNPNTVKQAYQELEQQGIAYVQRGNGTFVAGGRTRRDDRVALARGVAERALLEATRNGLNAEELIEAIQRAETRAGQRNGRGRRS